KNLMEIQEKRNTDVQTLKLSLTKEQAVFEERLREVPEEVRVLAELDKQISAGEKQIKILEHAWEKAQNDLQIAKDEQTSAISNENHAQKQLKETISKREESDKAFLQALEDASFPTFESYQEAKMDVHDRQALKKEIETFRQSLLILKQEVDQLTKELRDEPHTDLQALETELEQLKNNMEKAMQKRDQSRNYLAETKKLLDQIIKSGENVKTQEETLRVVVDLYDVMRGQNSQKISFERYLQIEYLEQIIETANMRLTNSS